ncbi:MAG: NTP transferase domain-containing protein [Acidimicrobiales bacterium]
MSTAAVVLAAGAGSRYQGNTHKLLALWKGRSVVRHALDPVLAAGFDEVIVVDGAVDLSDVLSGARVTLLHNPAWADGQATSLRVAIAAADHAGHEAVVVGLGDQPLIPAEVWRAVAASDAPLAVASYGGRRRNPVRLHRSVWSLLPVAGDEGARTLMRARPELVTEVACEGDPMDVDTVEDLRALDADAPRRGP